MASTPASRFTQQNSHHRLTLERLQRALAQETRNSPRSRRSLGRSWSPTSLKKQLDEYRGDDHAGGF